MTLFQSSDPSNINRLNEQAAQRAHGMVDQLHAGMDQAALSLQARAKDLQAAQRRWTGSTREVVREHPLMTIGVALAAGLILSRLVRR